MGGEGTARGRAVEAVRGVVRAPLRERTEGNLDAEKVSAFAPPCILNYVDQASAGSASCIDRASGCRRRAPHPPMCGLRRRLGQSSAEGGARRPCRTVRLATPRSDSDRSSSGGAAAAMTIAHGPNPRGSARPQRLLAQLDVRKWLLAWARFPAQVTPRCGASAGCPATDSEA